MSRSWAGGSTTRWRKLRAAVLLANAQTNRGRCTVDVGKGCPKHGRPCPGVCTGTANTAHHTRGRAVTGDDPRYLAASCMACNLHIGEPKRNANKTKPNPVSWA